MITKTADLNDLCTQIDAAGRFAIDLEFIPERNYSPVLCLIQVAVEDQAFLIDPLAIKDLDPLWGRVADSTILKVIHAAGQDLDLIYGQSGLVPKNIFDTQIGAGFAGFGYPVGYGKLLHMLLNVYIAKTESFTDWLIRPLTEAQIQYATEDVCHLLGMYDRLVKALKHRGRLDWAKEECLRYEDEELYKRDRSREFLKIKGANSLDRRGLAVLQQLCLWRDDEARRINRPARSVLGDNILLELARRRNQELQKIRGVRPDQIRAYSSQLQETIKSGLALSDEHLPNWPSSRVPPKGDVLVGDLLFAVLKVIAYDYELAPELVATRDELQFLVRAHREKRVGKHVPPDAFEQRDPPEISLLEGWRNNVAGHILLKLLDGASVSVAFDGGEPPVQLTIKDEDGEEQVSGRCATSES